MRSVRRVFGYLALAAVALLFCLELSHWGDSKIDLISEDAAGILRREPAAAITEEERATLDEAFRCAAVQELLDSGENGDLCAAEEPSLQAAADCLGAETAGLFTASVIATEEGPALILSWSVDGNRTLLERMEKENGVEYFKTYGRNGFLGTMALYENWDNEKVRQSRAHHWWFSWLLADR